MFMKHYMYAPNRCEPSIEALNFRGGDEGRCERRSEVCVKLKKKLLLLFIYFFIIFFLGGGGVGLGGGGQVRGCFWGGGGGVRGGEGWGGQFGCERRIEIFVKIQKHFFFLGGGGSGWM